MAIENNIWPFIIVNLALGSDSIEITKSMVTYLGCYLDGVARTMSYYMGEHIANNTRFNCARSCYSANKTFIYSGTEVGYWEVFFWNRRIDCLEKFILEIFCLRHECFCDYSSERFEKIDETRCNQNCHGDQNETCGDNWSLSISKLTVPETTTTYTTIFTGYWSEWSGWSYCKKVVDFHVYSSFTAESFEIDCNSIGKKVLIQWNKSFFQIWRHI